MKINPFITKLQIYKFFDDFVIIYPLYTLMFESSGLNLNQISILLLVWSLTSFALEIPSGVFADKYNRKTILVFAQAIRIVGFAFWMFMPNFLGYLIGFILWGIKSAFTSGTLEAYLYDGLVSDGKEKSYSKVLGSLKSLSFIAILLSSIFASALFFISYKSIMLLSIIALAISAVILSTSKSKAIRESTEETKYFSLLMEGLGDVFKNYKLLINALIVSLFVGAMAIDEYFALYIEQARVSIHLVGYLFAVYSLIQAFGSWVAYKFESKNFQLSLLGGFSILIFLIGLTTGYMGVILFMILALVSAIGQIISNTALQKVTKGKIRATVSSVSGFFSEIVAFTAYTVFFITPSSQVKTGLVIYGSIILAITIIVLTFILLKGRLTIISNKV